MASTSIDIPKKVSLAKVSRGQKKNRLASLFSAPALAVFLLISMMIALMIGAYPFSREELFSLIIGAELSAAKEYLFWDVRLPRVLMAVIVGGGLAGSGAAIQRLFRNPLADPGLIGVTSGAMVFAVLTIVGSGYIVASLSPFLKYALLTFSSFLGGLLATLLVYRMATSFGRTSVVIMLLAGIALTAFAGAITGLIIYFSNEEELRDITFWTLGSIGGADWAKLVLVGPLILFSLVMLIRQDKALAMLNLGEREAAFLGVDVQKLKWLVIGFSALAVGACVAVSGMIGFVALVVPHLIRIIHGTNYHALLLNAALLGGILLLVADAIARIIIAPAELPIGIITSLIGAPFFIFLILRARRTQI